MTMKYRVMRETEQGGHVLHSEHDSSRAAIAAAKQARTYTRAAGVAQNGTDGKIVLAMRRTRRP